MTKAIFILSSGSFSTNRIDEQAPIAPRIPFPATVRRYERPRQIKEPRPRILLRLVFGSEGIGALFLGSSKHYENKIIFSQPLNADLKK